MSEEMKFHGATIVNYAPDMDHVFVALPGGFSVSVSRDEDGTVSITLENVNVPQRVQKKQTIILGQSMAPDLVTNFEA